MSEVKAKRRAILILGMHRSGTSAVTGVVSLLGVQLGDHLLPPAADNESGFWEHEGVVEIDDHLLNALGRGWHDLRALPHGWLQGDEAKTARVALVELLGRQFDGNSLWAVKDPRICLLLPLWLDVLQELGVEPCALLVVRHPVEVAQSVQVRNGLPLSQSLWLWMRYTMAAELATRGLPRAAVVYPELLTDWRGTMTRAAAAMQVDWPVSMESTGAVVDAFLDASQRHHDHATVTDADLPPVVRSLYAALLAAGQDGSNWAPIKRIVDRYARAEGLIDVGLDAAYTMGDSAGTGDGEMDRELLSTLATSILGEAPVEPPAQPSLRDVTKIYWQCGDDPFEEVRAVSVEHAGLMGPTRFAFRLPDGVRPDSVRFDPSLLPGQFEVLGLRVDGHPIDDMAARVLQVNQHRLPSSCPGHVRVLGFDGDAWVRFDLRDCSVAGSGPVVIEVICRHESARDWMRNVIDVAVVSGMASTVRTMTDAVAANLEAIRRGNEEQLRVLREHQANVDEKVTGLDAALAQWSDRCARHEALTLQSLTKATAVNLDVIRRGNDRQLQAVAEQQKRVGTQMARIEQSLLDMSDRSAQREAATVQALTAAMAADLDAVKHEHEVMMRMVGEWQARADTQATTIGHDLAQNAQQLMQVEAAMQVRLDRLLAGMAAMLDNQHRSFWSRLRRK